MTRVLMIGSFLSKKSGSLSISEKLALYLDSTEVKIRLVSHKENKILRITEVVLSCLLLRYQRMHIDTYSGQAFMIAEISSFIGKKRNKKVILTLHGGKLPEYFSNTPDRVRNVLNRVDHIQTPSLYLKEFFTEKGFSIRYMPNSINLARFPYKRDTVKQFSLLWVRAFTDIYNPDTAVKILYDVKRKYPDATLTMVGPDKGKLTRTKELITRLGLNSSVTITGPVPNNILYQYYQTHAVFLNTTSYESFGVAVLEAASCGIPIVSVKVGEIPFLWKHGQDILMAEDLKPSKFADEIFKIFSDPSLADVLSKNARKKAEEYDWELIREKWIRLLSD